MMAVAAVVRVVVAARHEEAMHRAVGRKDYAVGCGRVPAEEWVWACRAKGCGMKGVGNVMRCKCCGKPVMPALVHN